MIRRAPVLVIVAVVLTTVAFWFLLYQPSQANEAALRDEAAALDDERAQLEARVERLREVEENVEDFTAQVDRVEELIPDRPAQPQVLRELQRAADASGVEITELTFGDPELVSGAPDTGDPATVLTRIPTQMSMSGGFFQVVDLLRRIEVDLARALKVDTVTMNEDEELSFPTLSATWTGAVFAVLPIEDVPGAEDVIDAEADDDTAADEDPAADDETTESSTEGATPPADDTGAPQEPTAPAGDEPPAPDGDAKPPPPPDGEPGGDGQEGIS